MNITSKQVAIGAGIVILAYLLFRNKLKNVSRTAEEGGGGGSGGGGGVFGGGIYPIPVVTVPVATVPSQIAITPHTTLPPNPIYTSYQPKTTGISKTPEMAHKASGDEYYMDLVSTQGGNDGFSF